MPRRHCFYNHEQLIRFSTALKIPELRPQIPDVLKVRTHRCRAGPKKQRVNEEFQTSLPLDIMGKGHVHDSNIFLPCFLTTWSDKDLKRHCLPKTAGVIQEMWTIVSAACKLSFWHCGTFIQQHRHQSEASLDSMQDWLLPAIFAASRIAIKSYSSWMMQVSTFNFPLNWIVQFFFSISLSTSVFPSHTLCAPLFPSSLALVSLRQVPSPHLCFLSLL